MIITRFIDCLASMFCHEGELTQGLCTNILFVLCGFDEAQMNKTLLPDILHHTPAGASTHTVLHYAQAPVYILQTIEIPWSLKLGKNFFEEFPPKKGTQ